MSSFMAEAKERLFALQLNLYGFSSEFHKYWFVQIEISLVKILTIIIVPA